MSPRLPAGLLALLLITTTPALGTEDPFAALRESAAPAALSHEAPEGWFEATRAALRLDSEWIGRVGWRSRDQAWEATQAVGLELFAPIVTPSGTWGSLDVQLRLVLDFPFERPDFQAHTVYLEKRFLFGRLNLRAGHFELPFNLAAWALDTHTTLVQLGTMASLGVKHDWGLALHGQLARVDYALAYTLGAGMDPALTGTGLGTGRVGWNAADRSVGAGLSFSVGERRFHGGHAHNAIFGYRLGADVGLPAGPLWLGFELAAGQDEGEARATGLARAMAESPGGLLLGTLQLQAEWAEERPLALRGEIEGALRLGFLSRSSYLRLNLSLDTLGDELAWSARTQLYLRFGG